MGCSSLLAWDGWGSSAGCGAAAGAAAPEDDLGGVDPEAVGRVGIELERRHGEVDVLHAAAGVAHQVVVVGHVGVEPARPGAEVERSEESSVGKECVRTCRSRWSQ